jgi:Mn2+/Fe2+ NRAMP family transporter
MVVIMGMATSRKVMGTFVLPAYLKVLGWLAAIVMSMVLAGLVLTWHA